MTTFLLAVFALLLTPGPTNTLLALSGVQRGLVRSLPLLPVEICAYLLVVIPAAFVGHELAASSPMVARAMQFGAAVWVLYLAVRLWAGERADAPAREITAWRVFVTTLLNPKALIVGLVLLPSPHHDDAFALYIAAFAASIALVALIWASGGALLGGQRRGAGGAYWLYRVASAWLMIVSVGLATRAFAG